MTRYQLPAKLGGLELPEDTGGHFEDGVWLLRFDVPGGGRIRVQKEALEELPEPLPPEPQVGSVVLVGADSASDAIVGVASGYVWRRYHNGWTLLGTEQAAATTSTWAHVCKYGPPVLLLVPDLVDAPALPWRAKCAVADDVLAVDEFDGQHFPVVIRGRGTVYLNPVQARELGLALLRAAGEVST